MSPRGSRSLPRAPEDQWMTCRDGTRLISRIWRPSTDQPGAPVLLMRQPYGRAIASTVTYAHPSWYANQGFLVVVQDVRGRGDSEGQFSGFQQEASDGADAVRWARQLPGSNGRVGMYGFSYQGITQLLNDGYSPDGADGAPGLDPLADCLAPAMCGLDERQHWASDGGAHWWALGMAWGLQLAAQGLIRSGNREGWRQIRRSLTGGTFLEEGLALLEEHDPEGMGLGWLQRDPRSAAGWRCHQPLQPLWRRPMLLIGGWWDPHLRGVLDLWQRSREAGGEPELCIGPWSHLNWSEAQPLPAPADPEPPAPEPGSSPGGGATLDELQLAFFQRHLGLAPNPDRPRSLLHDLRTGVWERTSPHMALGGSWSLVSGGLANLVPQEGQLLPSDQSCSSAGQAIWLVHDPWRPCPGRGGHLGLDAGPCLRHDLDARTDVACFTTAALDGALTLQGEPVLELVVQADQPGFDLCCALSVLRPSGTAPGAGGATPAAEQLVTGMLRVLGGDALESRRRVVRFQPLRASLAPGERLRLSVATAAWPQVAVNPGTGESPQGGVGPDHRVITLTLHLDGAVLSIRPMVGAN